MELGAELEDDLLFADLSKQISLLIMDDDDDHDREDPLANCPSLSLQAFSHAIQQPPLQAQLVYEQMSCKRESKGTGVFIPQSTQPRRKQRQQARFNGGSNYAKSHLRQNQQHNFHQQEEKVHDSAKMVVVSQQVSSNNGYGYGYGYGYGSLKAKYGRA